MINIFSIIVKSVHRILLVFDRKFLWIRAFEGFIAKRLIIKLLAIFKQYFLQFLKIFSHYFIDTICHSFWFCVLQAEMSSLTAAIAWEILGRSDLFLTSAFLRSISYCGRASYCITVQALWFLHHSYCFLLAFLTFLLWPGCVNCSVRLLEAPGRIVRKTFCKRSFCPRQVKNSLI